MSQVGNVIVTTFIIILVLVIGITIIEFFGPLSMKKEFDFTCEKYMMKFQINGGLQESEINQLEAELTSDGFANVMTNITELNIVSYSQDIQFQVTCNYTYSRMMSLFNRANDTVNLNYNKTFPKKKLVN